ncbi:3-dehydroquinate synthase [Candidatus Roizmanbacteria bacterium CG02_land_8_20_14_3_00_36_15]|uniref:3-dehydroquinate synthase n=4 Tax=Candidatus Roizmaniibacteriota TaxID=1752723 RepID=A0A2M7BVI3_9BACT|nr:MAG: 3-dehydroquinate synthase [Candidatus Roizmanbacteria bacterium CG11_big_fil_rev_8_21_14_0_20_35_14]PIV10577.1 MAG: 3-dehydroquinate synthase [Candidatus Roizmanbacteria bacterium CG03_land_8_20_14_0_80_35_26]PIV38214.1 MAG: 3-dehydroquinate synthase [Candidatus Roizmanbacteria bacterium CG02_land_8_20_14_3_00_36_15]PIZ68562.1 MAG: 3-dehydroquinate synthase [Candidatus Roizmanbacteria bacterium CG_4_10_14_0_2_um_filter_36_35]PJC31682.1 MAG: 3-dehydroquinate synthase [Candidatus Roizmanb
MEKIIIGNNLLSKINQLFDFDRFSTVAVLTDTNVAKHWLLTVKRSLKQKISEIIIKQGEKEKNIKTVRKIWGKMFENGLDRQSLLINLGGGVICDMGGFAASTFMRGIDFINIPTTLLAQVDASVGGKNGIDFQGIKNSIGIFENPMGVVIDVSTLKTLPKRELVSAFGEIIKHGVISGRKYFDLVTSKIPEEFSQEELIRIVKQSVEIKSNIVKEDPEENNLRKVLNFGHTIGHAIESLSWKTNKPLLHGEAVAVGIIAESKLSNLLGMLSKKDFLTIEKTICQTGLPTRIENLSINDILRIMAFDKKNTNKKILWSLPEKIGKVNVNIEAPNNLIIRAIESIII